MTTLREAAQQALEALEEVNKSPWLEDCYHAFDDEVTALRAALAEPEPQEIADLRQACQEGWRYADEQFSKLCNTFGFAPSRALREMLDAATRQAVIAEREACAKVCEEVERKATHQPPMVSQGCQACAAAIRSRT